jgi:hypothetical protein
MARMASILKQLWLFRGSVALVLLLGCQNSVKKTSLPQAVRHVASLVEVAKSDVSEVRTGMPEGSRVLESLYRNSVAPKDDLERVRVTLARARDRVQDLRVAKSTFFALVEPDGTILRSDRVPDNMAGRNLWSAIPTASEVVKGNTVSANGALAEAAGVKGRADGQWFWLVPVTVDGKVQGAYVTGWSWSAYAYRLETALRNELKTVARKEHSREPLAYVYLDVGDAVYGAPLAPEVNASAICRAVLLAKLGPDQIWSSVIEVTGREFALAVKRAPELGPDVAVAVLRSET